MEIEYIAYLTAHGKPVERWGKEPIDYDRLGTKLVQQCCDIDPGASPDPEVAWQQALDYFEAEVRPDLTAEATMAVLKHYCSDGTVVAAAEDWLQVRGQYPDEEIFTAYDVIRSLVEWDWDSIPTATRVADALARDADAFREV